MPLSPLHERKNLKGIFITGGFVPSGYGCGYETILEFIRALEVFQAEWKENYWLSSQSQPIGLSCLFNLR